MQNRPNPNAPRRLTRQQYEALMRQRRQNRIAIAIIAGIAVLIIAAVVLILKPKGKPDAVTAMVETTAVPEPTQSAAGSGGSSVPDLAAMTGTEPALQDGTASDGEDAAVAAEVTPIPELPQAIDHVVSTRRPDGSLRSVRMRVVGDIMFCQSQLVYAKDSGYDFHNQFEMISEQLADADYTMGNMEGTIGKYKKSQYSGYPQFNAPDVGPWPTTTCWTAGAAAWRTP